MAPNPQNIAPNRDVEPPAAATPAQAVEPQVVRLAESARELQRVIRAANGLPPGFPEDEILALADALQVAPEADPEARLEAAIYARERFVDCRRRFVSEASDDPELPGIETVAHALNDTIAELSTLAVAAGREAEARAQPDRAVGTSIVATEAAGSDVVEVTQQVEVATSAIQQVETELRSLSGKIYIDQSHHYHILNFSVSVNQLKLPVKMIGAIIKGEFLDRAWLDKLTETLAEARGRFEGAWVAVKAFLEELDSLVDAVRRLGRDIAGLIERVRALVRRLFRRGGERVVPGTIFKDIDAPWCPEMVVIPAGSFVMGSPEDEVGRMANEGPQHEVRLEYRFAVGRYPITFDEYGRFVEATGRTLPYDLELPPPYNLAKSPSGLAMTLPKYTLGWGRVRRPIINVSWHDAQAYIAWLSQETRQSYRLLSEAEWEYACRAGTTTRYWWGNDITPENANYDGNAVVMTTEVGSYPPNPWGLYDMHGNVWEWVEDCGNDSYEGAPDDGSAWTSRDDDSGSRMVRGGAWFLTPEYVRSASRSKRDADLLSYDFSGFRVSRTLTLASPPLYSLRSGRSSSRFL